MRIHVVGARPGQMSEQDFEQMKQACLQIGQVIARHGHSLSIGSLRGNTADHYIVQGALKEKNETKLVIYHRKDDRPIDDLLTKFKTDFGFAPDVHYLDGTSHSRHITALSHANAVLIVGGNRGTATAGFAAPAMQKPILALPQFKGAGQEVWEALRFAYGRSTITENDLRALEGSWHASSADLAINTLESFVRVNPFSSSISRPQWIFNIITITCMLLWIVLFSMIDELRSCPAFFALIFLSSFIGVAFRNLLKVYLDLTESFSPRKIINDFMIAAIVSFAFFLIYFVGGVIYQNNPLDIFNGNNIARSSAFMSAVTLSASLLLERSVSNIKERIQGIIDKDVKFS